MSHASLRNSRQWNCRDRFDLHSIVASTASGLAPIVLSWQLGRPKAPVDHRVVTLSLLFAPVKWFYSGMRCTT